MCRFVPIVGALMLACVTGCAHAPGHCPSDMPEGEHSLVIDGGKWSVPPTYGAITAKTFVQKDAGCSLRPFARIMSATLPPEDLYAPLEQLAEKAAQTHEPPLLRQDIVVLRTGYGAQVRRISGRLFVLPLFSTEESVRKGTVVTYILVEDWDGPLPPNQPWVRRK